MTATHPIVAARTSGQRLSTLLAFVAVLLIPAVLGSSSTIFNDGDVSWHIATGEWIIDHRAIPHVDPFSFTWAGKPWVPMEWLADLIYASAYRTGGYGAVAAVVTAALIGLHAAVYFNAGRWIRTPLLAVIAMDVALVPMLLARPHVLTWPLLAFWTWLMLAARENNRAPPLIAALLMTLLANLHGGFVFGVAIAGAFGLEALLVSADKKKALRDWLIFGAVCTLAVLINGNGLEGVLYPLRFTQIKMLPLIDEWKPSTFEKTPLFFGTLAFILGLVAWRRPRLEWTRWLLLGALFSLAMLQVRHQAMFAIVAAMVLPQGFARGRQPEAKPMQELGWVLGAGAVLLIAVRASMPLEPPENEANPWKLIAQVPPQLRSEHVLNGYSMGGPLILSGIRPYIDGRGDMYGDELVLGYADIVHGDATAFARAVQRWNIRWVILANRTKLVAVLDRTPGWRLLRRDPVGSIYVRTD